ncbi:MAG: phosphoribosylformylglycinamidine synthase II [Candidatus Rokubacteria bacterium RBG_16_73_20]|nr:MAG: phosphoribosylformylglycinamidine synthase II [Candidatus Rokubacteria bacterium GWA2_73_35]OGK96911.1 MAG: phosphoribosylformylglycinamidine synthase II [Candidatus Rokubacteria bacterium RBG_16_73_20]
MKGAEPKVTVDLARDLGLTAEEYDRIVTRLGREPTWTELGLFSALWSEHCAYKHSRVYLGRLPTRGPRVLQGPGENAGAIDIGDGWAVVFKMESHNHPSFIEPFQGAATGVGGILRDIFTMGARPIAILDSLRFGDPGEAKTRHLVNGVVSGISWYGNCFGCPTVGGEIAFAPEYAGNPLVNVMCVGLVRADRLFRARAEGVGNPVFYVGNKTGRDGIHGATMASATFDEHAEARRPTVQVGDPFTEKLLLEACLEAMRTGAVVGIQDMGAAGLACCTSEMPARAGTGMEVELGRVPQRETAMTPYEILLSESQERMLLVAARGREEEVRRVFARWELDAVEIGRVTAGGELVARLEGEVVARVPVALLAEAPEYRKPVARPAWLDERLAFDPLGLPAPADWGEALLELLGSPTLASKEWAYRQYDQQVGINTLVLPGSDAAVLRVKGTRRALAVATDGNGRLVLLDPRRGAAMAVAEAARNVSCAGGLPLGLTDCMNFGSPERPEILWQFAEAVEGLAEACRVLDIPVVGGNVSFYNETSGQAILPTPVVGVVGLLEDATRYATQWFKAAGHAVALLGPDAVSLGGSEYLWTRHRRLAGRLAPLDLEAERRVQAAVRAAVTAGLVSAAHDCAEGGLAVTLAEACVTGREPLGCAVRLAGGARPDLTLFGEGPSRVVVEVEPARAAEFEALMRESAISWRWVGETGGARLRVDVGGTTLVDVPLERIEQAWRNGFERHMA